MGVTDTAVTAVRGALRMWRDLMPPITIHVHVTAPIAVTTEGPIDVHQDGSVAVRAPLTIGWRRDRQRD